MIEQHRITNGSLVGFGSPGPSPDRLGRYSLRENHANSDVRYCAWWKAGLGRSSSRAERSSASEFLSRR
jgi:hypothetical protein